VGHTSQRLDPEELFRRLLTLERKRSDRTGQPFLLVLIHCEALIRRGAEHSIGDIGIALAASVRVTDVTGWHGNRSTIGLVFTSFNGAGRTVIQSAISSKIHRILNETLHASEVDHVKVSFHFYPQDGEPGQVPTNDSPIPGSEDLAGNFFDDMVRMDIQYIRERSIWGDLRILLRTPFAVIGGHGAY